jgi:hypothetical protein
MLEELTFLEEGEYTKRDFSIKFIAKQIKNSDKNKIPLENISNYLKRFEHLRTKPIEFRKRQGRDVLISGYYNGCTDICLAFLVVARALGIPARYVETFQEEWLNNPDDKRIVGHVFADVKIDGKWKVYEPLRGFTPGDQYVLKEKPYREVGKGLDFSQVFIKEDGVYRPNPLNLQKLDEAVKIFKPSQK